MKSNWRLELRPEYIRESQRHIKNIFKRKPFSTYAGRDYDPAKDALGMDGDSRRDEEGKEDMRIKSRSEIEIAVRLYVADLVDALDGIIETAALMVDEGNMNTEAFNAVSEKVQLIQDGLTK